MILRSCWLVLASGLSRLSLGSNRTEILAGIRPLGNNHIRSRRAESHRTPVTAFTRGSTRPRSKSERKEHEGAVGRLGGGPAGVASLDISQYTSAHNNQLNTEQGTTTTPTPNDVEHVE